MLVTQSQVEQALQRPLTESELLSLEHLVAEAELLIAGYLRKPEFPDPAPKAVTVVCARVVARALNISPDTIGVQSEQRATGPFSHSTTYVPETRSGNAVYLSKTDKEMLAPLKPSGIRHLKYGGS